MDSGFEIKEYKPRGRKLRKPWQNEAELSYEELMKEWRDNDDRQRYSDLMN